MKRILLSIFLIPNFLLGYNPADIETLIQSLSTNSPGCPSCDLTQLDFSKTITDLDAGSDSYATAMNQYNPTFTSKYGSNPTLAKIVSGTNLNLSGAELANTNMSGIKFGKVNLESAHASGINLSSTTFTRNSSFKSANLSGANLSKSTFIESDFSSASLYASNMSNSNFTNANLTGVGFGGANVDSTNFTSATMVDLFTEMDQNLTVNGKTITKGSPLDLRSVSNLGANTIFTKANLSGANLTGLNLNEINFEGANLSTATLDSVNFESTNLESASLESAKGTSVNFSSANIKGTNLSKSTLTKATFDSGTQTSSCYTGSTSAENEGNSYTNNCTYFAYANLSNSIFSRKTNMLGVDFGQANLTSITVNPGANFSYTNLYDVKLKGSYFNQANISNAYTSTAKFDGSTIIPSSNSATEVTSVIDAVGASSIKPTIYFPTASTVSGLDLVGKNISGITFSNINFTGLNASQGTNLTDVAFRNCSFDSTTSFAGESPRVTFKGSQFIDCKFNSPNFECAYNVGNIDSLSGSSGTINVNNGCCDVAYWFINYFSAHQEGPKPCNGCNFVGC